jgi:primary-amine oxidase
MTATTSAPDTVHPLARMTADEITTVREVVSAAGLLTGTTRFAYVGLLEPHKGDVLGWEPGAPTDRRFRVLLLDRADGSGRDVTVSLRDRSIVDVVEVNNAVDGQLPILMEEITSAIEPILAADERWAAAMAKRGLDVRDVRLVPQSAGAYYPEEQGHRMLRVVGFHDADPGDLPWAHPVDGVVAYVDITRGVATAVHDYFQPAVPAERANLDAMAAPARSLKPIEITQPEGPSFTVADDVVRWAGWEFRVGFDAREGLILHQLSIDDRPVVYRASIAEMVVAYGDPSPVRFWQNYFDTGEYLVGRLSNSLELGCDCLGEIHYFDAEVADDAGSPNTIRNAICLHEEDHGIAWKHTDLFTGMNETRRSRRLVISFFIMAGNYDYGFYWYLYTDGTIEHETKATGVPFPTAFGGPEFATEVAPGLGAPFHQHLFSARLDMTVDGPANTVYEVDAARVPVSGTNPHGNAFTRTVTPLLRESESGRLTDGTLGRTWHIVNESATNRLGQPTGYALHPQNSPVLLADDSSSIYRRATFATRSLWVTAYDPAELYPAGDLVNQHPGSGGLPAYVQDDAPLQDTDIVVWHTFGLTHFPRPEDWPVMPVDHTGFALKPVGFFDHNPALGLPRLSSAHCAAPAQEENA